MPKEIIHSKLEYLQLLWENQETGLTTTDIVDVYFDDIDQKAVSMALKRLVYQNSARRIRTPGVPFGYTYFINDYGIQKLGFLQDRETLAGSQPESEDEYLEDEIEDESEEITEEELEDEIRMLEQELAKLNEEN